VVARYFPEFMAFYFPGAHAQIDWRQDYAFLTQELQSVAPAPAQPTQSVDQLVRVMLHSGEEKRIYIHIETGCAGQAALAELAEHMFVHHCRIYDLFRQPIASLALVAHGGVAREPSVFGYDALGCQVEICFPTVRLGDFAGREQQLRTEQNLFALVTLGHLLTLASGADMAQRFAHKWELVQLLFVRGWERQRVLDLFLVLDAMMGLPPRLAYRLWRNIETLEEQQIMRYVSSVERFIREREWQEGMRQGASVMLSRLLARRFGELPLWVGMQLSSASPEQKEVWFDRALAVETLDAVFADDGGA
jgi:hypothetical protein